MSNGRCYHVQCASDEQCFPVKRAGMADKWKMVLVNPTTLGKLNLIQKKFCGFLHNSRVSLSHNGQFYPNLSIIFFQELIGTLS